MIPFLRSTSNVPLGNWSMILSSSRSNQQASSCQRPTSASDQATWGSACAAVIGPLSNSNRYGCFWASVNRSNNFEFSIVLVIYDYSTDLVPVNWPPERFGYFCNATRPAGPPRFRGRRRGCYGHQRTGTPLFSRSGCGGSPRPDSLYYTTP